MTRTEILTEADRIVNKDRSATHGEPEDNFRTIAELWTAYLRATKHDPEEDGLFAHDIAIMNILQKVSRVATSPNHPDHWIDIAGYAACGGQCAMKENL